MTDQSTNTHELIEALEMVISRLDKAKYQRELDEYDCVTMTYDRDEIDKIRQALAIQPQAEAQPGVGELVEALRPFANLVATAAEWKSGNVAVYEFRDENCSDLAAPVKMIKRAREVLANLTPAQPAGDVRERVADLSLEEMRRHAEAETPGPWAFKAVLDLVAALSATPAVSGWRFLDAIYDAEINVQFGTFWDGGIDWTLGDHMNGVKAEGTCRTWPDVERELRAAIAVHYPAVTLPPQNEGGDGDG